MSPSLLNTPFARIGARLQLGKLTGANARSRNQPLTLDVRTDSEGEFFDIRVRSDTRLELDVIDLRRRDRHLLLRAREERTTHFFICGHDEQHWFVAGVPGIDLGSVAAATEALKPPEVLEAQRRQGVKGKDRQRRKNAAYVRQGEWFFLPVPKLRVDKKQVLLNEPLSRGEGSKPHWAEFLYRKGGEVVYVCDEYPQGLKPEGYFALLRQKSRAKAWNWRRMVRNPEAYVKGKVSHVDHKTIVLQVWHRVVMNTEGQSQAMRHVVFLD
ncbi:MAG TPA: hypothetical protein VH682_10275 [Gemmataceae bacterium]|jgi:hypothetical protein